MRGFALAAGLLLLLAPTALADEAPQPTSENAIYLRLMVGIETPKLVTGFMDESKGTGTGYDIALLDLDGDGSPETRQVFGTYQVPRTERTAPDPKIRITHEDCEFVLDLRYSRFTPVKGVAATYIRWSVTKGSGFYAWFINGRVNFFTSAEEAAKADPIKMGPPFHFETGTRTRGREGLVTIGLKDANGCTLRLARKDGKQVAPQIKLMQDGEEVYQTQASYG
jgi:hypothetical protein